MNWIFRSNKITSFLPQTSGVKMISCFDVRQKDGVVISASGRVAITSGGHGDGGVIHSLSISKVESSDAGKYTVRAFNDFGESRFTATVLVKGWQFHFPRILKHVNSSARPVTRAPFAIAEFAKYFELRNVKDTS